MSSSLPNGLYDLLLDADLRSRVADLLELGSASIEKLAPPQRRQRLAAEIARLLPELLDAISEAGEQDESESRELEVINQLLAMIRRQGVETPDLQPPVSTLRAIHREGAAQPHPPTGLSAPWLFTAGRADPSLFAELRAELAATDRVDILVSFITWSGLRKLWDVLESITAVGANGLPRTRIRVITTTYIGATEARAVEALAKLPGVELRISLDGRRSRLHAKAWIFHRKTGFGTAFVGSANLSAAALLGGIEWTVKFTQIGQTDLYAAAEAHFETLWNDAEFQHFDVTDSTQRDRLRTALAEAKGRPASADVVALPTWFDLQPKAFQQAMLDRLAAERRLDRTPLMRNEIAELVDCLEERYDLDDSRYADIPAQWPLVLHGAYSRTEILTAIGTMNAERRPPARSGVIPLLTEKIEVLLVTLDKREGFHERIAYHDYAISPTLFHWQTQNSAGPNTKVGKRYSESPGNGWRFFLFVRERSEDPFTSLGAVTLAEEPTGNRPMSITWKLKVPIPLALFQRYSVLRG